MPLVPVLLLAAACSSGHSTAPAAAASTPSPAVSAPPPPLAQFLHPNYRVVSEQAITLEGQGRPADEVVVSTGPGLTPGQPVQGGTSDVQVLAFDPIAKRWNLTLDAADKIVPAGFHVPGTDPTQVSGDQVLFDQTHPVSQVWARLVQVAPGQPVLAIYGLDDYYNHPAGILAFVDAADGAAPTVTSYTSETNLSAPTVTGPATAQRVTVTADYLAAEDAACCPVRQFTETFGASGDPHTASPAITVVADDRPWLGAWVADDPLHPADAVVVAVQDRSPASSVLHVGDRLVGVDGAAKPANSAGNPVFDEIALHHPGDQITLTVSRARALVHLPVTLASRKDSPGDQDAPPAATIGIQGSDAPAGSTPGALVVAVQPGSPAEAAGLAHGDVITGAGDVDVRGIVDLQAALLGKIATAVPLTVGISHTVTVTVTPDPAPANDTNVLFPSLT